MSSITLDTSPASALPIACLTDVYIRSLESATSRAVGVPTVCVTPPAITFIHVIGLDSILPKAYETIADW